MNGGRDETSVELDRSLIRRLAGWEPGEVPVTSVYASVDGRRYPRKQDYELRLAEEVRQASRRASDLGREARRSVEGDCEAILAFVRDRFDRGSTRGLALFSASGAGLWEAVAMPRPVRNASEIASQPNVLQLEAMLDTYPTTCTALLDFEKGRLFLAALGRIEEVTDVWDDVPGRHDQGGWAQMRMQRHVDDRRHKHVKHVADALLRLQERRGFDHLVLAGTTEVVAELERELHDYVRRTVRARIVLPIGSPPQEILERSLELDEELERAREREAVERLRAGASGGAAVLGIDAVLGALWEARVEELVVDGDLRSEGSACGACGRLAASGGRCSACGSRTTSVPDVVEAGVALALRQGSRVETLVEDGLLHDAGGIGAYLRF